MKIHHATDGTDQYIELAANKGDPHENYPVNGDLTEDFSGYDTGASYTYFPYSFNFNKTYNLVSGDEVSLYNFIYGASGKTGFLATCGDIINSAGCYKNWTWNIQENPGSSIDIIETPSN
jgi:hypothetical protein